MSRSANPVAVTPGAGVKLPTWTTGGEAAVGHVQMGVDVAGQERAVRVTPAGDMVVAPRGSLFSALVNGTSGLYQPSGDTDRIVVGLAPWCELGTAASNPGHLGFAGWGTAERYLAIAPASDLDAVAFTVLNNLDVSVNVAPYVLVGRGDSNMLGAEASGPIAPGERKMLRPGQPSNFGNVRFCPIWRALGAFAVVGLQIKPASAPTSGSLSVGAGGR